jgi:HSP20 family protein
MDMRDNPDLPQITATLELPGLKKDEISLRIVDGSLVIWGERHSRLVSEGASSPDVCKVQEIKYGKFRRVIPLPQGVQVSHAERCRLLHPSQ